jgi:hypothetical protein
MRHAAVVAAIIGIALAGSAGADVVDLTPASDTVAQWQFSNDLNATFAAPGVIASAMGYTFSSSNQGHSSGDGINADGSSYTGGEPIEDSDWSGSGGRAWGRVFDDIETTAYEFSVTVDPGESIFIDSLVLDIGWRRDSPDHVRFAYSSDGFATETIFGEGQGFNENAGEGGMDFAEDGSLNVIPGPGNGKFSWNRYSADLGIDATGTVDFRLYFGAEYAIPDGSNSNVYIDNVTLQVPEPATMAMLGLGGLAALLRRRKA